jgi:hypothetical protein
MNFKLAIKNLFAKKQWVLKRTFDGETPGIKRGVLECHGNFFQVIWAAFIHEIRYPKI